MNFIADLHVHSKYARACSRNLELPTVSAWCQLKGIELVATGDFTHPIWFKGLCEQLEEIDKGVYGIKKKFANKHKVGIPESCRRNVRFINATEVSLIYKRGERVRKVHHLILAPNLDMVAKINRALDKLGNIKSDGRPILGLDSKDLLALLLGISPDIELIPAHAWTPHFAIFGSNSGFNSVEECFEELSPHIHAIETGLSSDPAMNWQWSHLDRFALVSNSDAHSPGKLGREATIFNTDRTYPAILHALRKDHQKVTGTIEFFPEEGKYHADGLRSEALRMTPEETRAANFISPKTGKKITVGVLHRVSDLANRKPGFRPPTARPYWSIIPLTEIIGEVLQVGPASQKVEALYFKLLEALGPEFHILKDAPVSDIVRAHPLIGEAIDRMRKGRVIREPGYDGEYGVIKLFNPEELVDKKQMSLF